MRVILITLLSLFVSISTFAQVTIGSKESPTPGAILQLKNIDNSDQTDLSNANKGLQMPRVLLTEKKMLYPMFGDNKDYYLENKSTLDQQHTGLLVFNTTANAEQLLCKGMNVWDGTQWTCLTSPRYTIDCSSVNVVGAGKKDHPLDPEKHYIELEIDIEASSVGLPYEIKTNTVDNISFSDRGILDVVGRKTIILRGNGTPTTLDYKQLTIITNSTSSNASCNAEFIMVIPKKSIYLFGSFDNTAGYLAQSGSGLRKMMDAAINFGENANSTFKLEQHIANTQTFYPHNISGIGASTVKSYLDQKPDIVMTGYDITDANTANYLVDYIKQGGVLILYSENIIMTPGFFRALYPDRSISVSMQISPTRYQLAPTIDDDITNGPFGNLVGKYWANDATSTTFVSGLPREDFIIYTENTTGISMARHKTYNLIFIGEGGFNANYDGGTGSNAGTGITTAYPFAIDDSFVPITRTGYSGGEVENSKLTANILAWAVYQAHFHGINTVE